MIFADLHRSVQYQHMNLNAMSIQRQTVLSNHEQTPGFTSVIPLLINQANHSGREEDGSVYK